MTHISASTSGVFVIACTPFTDNGAIDTASIDSMVDFYYEKGADGLTILGMMGEAPKLTQAESIEITRQTLARSAGKPVVVGVSAPGLAAIGELTKAVMDLGAAGVMVAPPSSLRTDEQIITYYRNVVETIGTDVPVVLQDFPLVTGVQISSKTLGVIFEAHPSIVMLKHEDWPGLQKITDLRAAEAKGPPPRVDPLRQCRRLPARGNAARCRWRHDRLCLSRDDGRGLPSQQQGKHEEAHDLFDAYLPLMRYEQQPGLGLAVRKYVLARRGAIASAAQRRPGAALNAAAVAEVERLIARQDRKLGVSN
jgi:4-hydroxy-tetrahydrodipicolinate synthase